MKSSIWLGRAIDSREDKNSLCVYSVLPSYFLGDLYVARFCFASCWDPMKLKNYYSFKWVQTFIIFIQMGPKARHIHTNG